MGQIGGVAEEGVVLDNSKFIWASLQIQANTTSSSSISVAAFGVLTLLLRVVHRTFQLAAGKANPAWQECCSSCPGKDYGFVRVPIAEY